MSVSIALELLFYYVNMLIEVQHITIDNIYIIYSLLEE